tara:strand:+ start:98 stop:565 length:468 start_codon:yes stop_codon:yes gene_type:complete
MFTQFKSRAVALATVAAIALPMGAFAQTSGVVVGRVVNGEFVRIEDTTPTDTTMTATTSTTAETGTTAATEPSATVSTDGTVTVEGTGDTTTTGVVVGEAVRNDTMENMELSIPMSAMPGVGECRLWYPDRTDDMQPEISDCDVTTPRGAILIKG